MIAGSHWLTAGVFDCVAAVEGPAAEEVFPPQAVSTRSDEARTHTESRSGSNRWRQMTVDAFEFIRRFLQHVLPSGFQKVRHFGFLSPNSQVSLEMVLWLVRLHSGLIQVLGA